MLTGVSGISEKYPYNLQCWINTQGATHKNLRAFGAVLDGGDPFLYKKVRKKIPRKMHSYVQVVIYVVVAFLLIEQCSLCPDELKDTHIGIIACISNCMHTQYLDK